MFSLEKITTAPSVSGSREKHGAASVTAKNHNHYTETFTHKELNALAMLSIENEFINELVDFDSFDNNILTVCPGERLLCIFSFQAMNVTGESTALLGVLQGVLFWL